MRVLRKRDDGYHDLETVFHRIDLFDDLTAERAERLSIACDDPDLANDGNLVLVAARALREKYGVRDGARITLTKRIPHGAGLGGGSSDAATALRILSRLWGLQPDAGELASIALAVGSDVPFFLGDGSAHGYSRGERLTWFSLVLPQAVLVVSPAIHVSTREAFGMVVPGGIRGSRDLLSLVRAGASDPASMRGTVDNDFEGPLTRLHPPIGAIRDELYAAGAAFAQLSGSGSSVFGLFPDERAARAAADRLGTAHRVFLTAPGFVPDLSISEPPGRGTAGRP